MVFRPLFVMINPIRLLMSVKNFFPRNTKKETGGPMSEFRLFSGNKKTRFPFVSDETVSVFISRDEIKDIFSCFELTLTALSRPSVYTLCMNMSGFSIMVYKMCCILFQWECRQYIVKGLFNRFCCVH